MPSRVAEILLEQGRQAARTREISGQIWGGLASQLGQIPGEVMQQRQQQQRQQLQTQVAQQDLALGQDRLRQAQHVREGQALTGRLVQQYSKLNPETGHVEYDTDAITNGLITGGHPEAAGHASELLKTINDNFSDIQSKNLAFETRKREGYANILGSVANAPEAEREDRYGVMIKALPPAAKTDPVLGKLPPVYPGHAAFTQLYEAQETDAQRLAKVKEKADEYAKGLKETPPGGKLGHVDLATGKYTLLAEGGPPAEKAETERHNKAMEAIDTLKVGREDAAQKELARHHKALETKSAAADKLIKVEHMDEATGRTVIEWLPQSEVRGQTFKKGVSGTLDNRLASAQAVNETGDDMIQKLSDPVYAAKVGPVLGRFNTLRDFIGNPPPEFAELAGQIESYSIATMGVHGMRSTTGADEIKKLLDQKHTPASIIATIKGLNAFSNRLMKNEGRVTTPSTGGGNRVYYDADGNPVKK